MKSTLTVEEYLDGSPLARAEMDEWLEKMGLIERGVCDVRIVRIKSNGRCLVAVWYYVRDTNGRYQLTTSGKPVIEVQNYDDAELPPLGFFDVVTK